MCISWISVCHRVKAPVRVAPSYATDHLIVQRNEKHPHKEIEAQMELERAIKEWAV